MINIISLNPIINKERIFEKLHIEEGTEAFKNAESVFDELRNIIINNMDLTGVFKVVDALCLSVEKLDGIEYVVCFISSDDNISEISSDMMSSGNYMKGYLLHEVAADVIFNASNEMNKIIREKIAVHGYKISGRYAPGDGTIDLSLQQTLLNILKNEIEINAYLNEAQILIPERSLLYMFGLKEGIEDFECCSSCVYCANINCQYRVVQ